MLYREDEEIITLFAERNEEAIREVQKKYGTYMMKYIMCRLHNEQDMEECLQDVYFALWNTVHLYRPESLKNFIFALCKRKACDRLRYRYAVKRNGFVSELYDVMDKRDAYEYIEFSFTFRNLIGFLERQGKESRKIFILKFILSYTLII